MRAEEAKTICDSRRDEAIAEKGPAILDRALRLIRNQAKDGSSVAEIPLTRWIRSEGGVRLEATLSRWLMTRLQDLGYCVRWSSYREITITWGHDQTKMKG